VARAFRSETRKRALNFMKIILPSWLCLIALIASASAGPLPTVDLANDTARQVVIAQGTPEIYQGHPTTLLLPDGKTMFAVWTLGHGGTCGPMKRSNDGGRTWGELLPTPENWAQVKNCPSLYRLTDPQGVTRLFVFAGSGPDRKMQHAHSADDGGTWTAMTSVGLECVMPFCTIAPVDGGKRLIGLTSIRRPGEAKDTKSNIITQSESTDGGLTWSPWRVLLDLGELKPCEPALVRSPNGKQLLCLIRENIRSAGSHFMTSDDEGRTWSKEKPLPPGLWGDRHMPHFSADGRLVVTFRDMGQNKNTHGHFAAWVGRYEDILGGRDGQYKIKLLHSHAGSDCGYSGLELLPDGTFVATTYIKYRPGPEKQSVVSTRFTLAETDALEKTNADPAAAPGPQVGGILLDDDAGEFTGDWVLSTKQHALVGKGYRHDDHKQQGAKSARFTAKIAEAGDYEVRLLYSTTNNRATNTQVTITSADGAKTLRVNQREECMKDGVPRSLGTFRFAAGAEATITISNAEADGFVVVDALQILPAALADAERRGERTSGFAAIPANEPAPSPRAGGRAAKSTPMAAAVAVSPLTKTGAEGQLTAPPSAEPIHLAKDASARDVDGKAFDLVVVGGTAGGVACAVRAAREGCSVLLVQHNRHIGGMLSNGLMQWDALYGGPRASLFTELLGNIEKDAVARFGKDSRTHQVMRYTHEHYPVGWVEPHVMERECNRLVAGEKNLTLLLEHYPVSVERDGALLKSATLRAYGTAKDIKVAAAMFADATYEGDLFALARVPYRVGREARDEFHEPHAGKVFCNIDGNSPESVAAEGLNIRAYGSRQGTLDATSPFTADGAVQAYNYRFCVSKDPANRAMLNAPPPGYDREEFVNFGRKGIATNAGPNLKSHMNSPILPGENHAYPEASWPEREKIIERHKNFGLGLIWFLQNDESVSEKKREEFRQWGLAKDEFADNGHVPYEMYVREARRIAGRHILTEHDGSLAKDYARAPVHADSVAVTDWYMDSHACTTESRPGFHYDGKLILTEESRPMQIPYRALLPHGVDNLLVPVCLSATHVAWGAIRLEPVWMQTGEAAGFAAALAKKKQTTPAALSAHELVRTLAERRQLVSFFNDVKADGPEDWIPAVEYFGTKGFFAGYDAHADKPLTESLATEWARAFVAMKTNGYDASATARRVAETERLDSPPTSAAEFLKVLESAGVAEKSLKRIHDALPLSAAVLTRGEACRALYRAE
jgi:hypothetical protein